MMNLGTRILLTVCYQCSDCISIAAVILFLLCAAVDPKTLKPMGRK